MSRGTRGSRQPGQALLLPSTLSALTPMHGRLLSSGDPSGIGYRIHILTSKLLILYCNTAHSFAPTVIIGFQSEPHGVQKLLLLT